MDYRCLFFILLIALLGCHSQDDNCYVLSAEDTYGVEGPDTVNVNETIKLAVSFPCWNGCGHFGEFEIIETSAFSKTVQLKTEYTGCICTMVASTQIADYYFTGSTPGNYAVNFVSGDSLITHHVLVM